MRTNGINRVPQPSSSFHVARDGLTSIGKTSDESKPARVLSIPFPHVVPLKVTNGVQRLSHFTLRSGQHYGVDHTIQSGTRQIPFQYVLERDFKLRIK